MNCYFTLSEQHKICDARRNQFKDSVMHPNRKLEEHDLIYILEGGWKIGQEAEHFYPQKGDVLILSAHCFHYGIEPCIPGTKTMYIHTLYHPKDCLEFHDCLLPSLIHARENASVKYCFEKIIYAKSIKNEAMASSYFHALLCELNCCSQMAAPNSLPEKIRQLILSSDKLLKNKEIATQLNISIKTAETVFKQAFQTTIHQYVISSKIEQVKFYLHNFPDMKLYEIAENLGFYDEFHLSRQFKKLIGLSPAEYKKTDSPNR